ncbi:hypothetical protein CsatB_023990 [Cannabis sativa]|uniref:kinesin-like protein KIN-14R n=1 Tax=Cannabis sativa TaxID=3483 RepID=UPI0029CA9A7D|nr:kinesin-like protein KIN-14R [Cannabis sativa]
MEQTQFRDSYQDSETLTSTSLVSLATDTSKDDSKIQDSKDLSMAEGDFSMVDSMLCDSGARVISTGLTRPTSTAEYVMFINAGGEVVHETGSSLKLLKDSYYEGGNVIRTNEQITHAGDYPSIYQSARLGNFCYRFYDLSPGEYYVDLHFTEIINTNGPKGMRMFNVFIQEEMVLSDFDIFAVAGANKPLQLVDLRVSVKEDRTLVIRFEGVIGSPAVSGIGIRTAPPTVSDLHPTTHESLKCDNCAADIVVPSAQIKLIQTKSTAKYEKKVQELTTQCQLKAKECYEAWMSLTSANEQLDNVRMELHNMTFKKLSQDQAMEKVAEDLRDINSKYEQDKKRWAVAINDLQEKIELMRKEHSKLSHEAHECADSIPDLNNMVSAVQALVAQCEDLKMKYSEEQAKRKKLFNEIQEAKGNIRVFCRCRPLNKGELAAGCTTVVDFDAAKDGCLGISSTAASKKSFKFDKVYTPKDNQDDVFADASPMVISVLDGYNVCIFAYGQTGTGKTFTMEGTEQNRGVNYRTLEQLFQISKERSELFTYDISVSVLEVYNEQIRDLLATSPTSKKLEIKQASEGSHHVPGIVEAKVTNIDQVWTVLQAGSNARAVGSNNVNEHSSRSHCLLCIMVRAKNLMNGECTKSKLWLVDLAGSERLAKTDAQGERLKEAQNINRSLSALGDVISALANKSSHIPYRNSKLTHLLQDSLGGDAKTLMFVQISPSDLDVGETLSSLNFATRVRGVELGPARKQVDTGEVQKMKASLEKLRQEVRSKDESLRKLEETLQNLENKTKGKDQTFKNQQEKIKELENQLELKATVHSQSEKQVSQLSDRLKGKEEICCSLQQKIKELETKLKERQQSESESFQEKVKDLETKLKDQMQEADCYAAILQQKIKELEIKLKEQQEQNSDSLLLHQKIKELEDKLREQEQQLRCTHDFVDSIKATPVEIKTCVRDELMHDIEPYILRSSNSIRPMSQGSMKGNDSTQGTRRKREFKSGETENIMMVSTGLNERKIRKSDPPKISRFMRTARPATTTTTTTTTTTQGPFTHNKRVVTKDQVPGVKERDNKKKIWSR